MTDLAKLLAEMRNDKRVLNDMIDADDGDTSRTLASLARREAQGRFDVFVDAMEARGIDHEAWHEEFMAFLEDEETTPDAALFNILIGKR